jgi:hypothetical protein
MRGKSERSAIKLSFICQFTHTHTAMQCKASPHSVTQNTKKEKDDRRSHDRIKGNGKEKREQKETHIAIDGLSHRVSENTQYAQPREMERALTQWYMKTQTQKSS